MPQTGCCTDVTCTKELTELYECHCCNWLICLKHLLEHVEISKRDKNEQLDSLHNELISLSYTLELIVEKKLHEIEREKQLINQAKALIDKSGHTIEEIQLISEEINQVIVSNRKEETIVKVESSLSDLNAFSYNNEIITDTMGTSNLYASSSSNNILQQPKSPIYRGLRMYPNGFEASSTLKSNDHSTTVDNSFNITNTDNEYMDSTKDEADDEQHDRENAIEHDSLLEQCPLTFDGAFGLTIAKHSIEICPIGNSRRRNLMTHFTQKHRLKKFHAYRLNQAVKYGQNPKTTKLFSENEDVINHYRNILCPFSSSMIHSIGCCPTQSRKIPCQSKSVVDFQLVLHLKKYHHLSASKAREIAKNYREKLSKMVPSNDDDALPH